MRTLRLLGLSAVAVLFIAACGHDSSSSASTADTPATSSGSTGAPAATTTGATVSLADSDEYGPHLVGPDGGSLYLFENDQGTTTACTGGCVDNWPPLLDAEPTGGEGIDASVLGTAEGIAANQVTYNGHLLYYFAGDTQPGDSNGVGIPAWYLLDASGNAIEDETAPGSGY